jgi:hypothetical protein
MRHPLRIAPASDHSSPAPDSPPPSPRPSACTPISYARGTSIPYLAHLISVAALVLEGARFRQWSGIRSFASLVPLRGQPFRRLPWVR